MDQTIAGLNGDLQKALKTNGDIIIRKNARSPASARTTTP